MYLTLLPPSSRSLVALGSRAILFPSLHASDFPSGGASRKDSKQRAAARLLTCKVFIQNLPADLLAHSLAWQDCGLMRTRAHVTASCACSSRCRWSFVMLPLFLHLSSSISTDGCRASRRKFGRAVVGTLIPLTLPIS